MNIFMLIKHNKKLGFTLIELVIVIVLIGILSAAALPKFATLITRARQAAASGVAGGLSAAASIAHAQWLADGSPESINLEGQLIYMSPLINGMGGWPEDTQAIGNGVATPDKCLAIWNGILNTPPKADINTCTAPCQYMVSADSPLCKFQDRQGKGDNIITYNITNGAVDSVENNTTTKL